MHANMSKFCVPVLTFEVVLRKFICLIVSDLQGREGTETKRGAKIDVQKYLQFLQVGGPRFYSNSKSSYIKFHELALICRTSEHVRI